MLSGELFEVLNRDDVERERMRGIFSIGAIAVLYYLRQINGSKPLILIPSIPTIHFTQFSTDGLMMLWAFYVVTMAMTLCAGKFTAQNASTRLLRGILVLFYIIARATYVTAVVMLLGTISYWSVLSFWQAPLLIIIVVMVIVFSYWPKPKRRTRQQVSATIKP